MKTKFKELFTNNKKRIIAIVLVLVLIASLIVYFVVRGNIDTKKTDTKAKTKTEQIKKDKDKKTEEKAKEENPASGDSSASSDSSGGTKKSGGGSSSGGGGGSSSGGGGSGSGGSGGGQTGHSHHWVTGTETTPVYMVVGNHRGTRCSACGTCYEGTGGCDCTCCDTHGWSSCMIDDWGWVDDVTTYTYCAICGVRK